MLIPEKLIHQMDLNSSSGKIIDGENRMPPQNKPNVILFMVDQLSARWLEVARNEGICALPNLDWLRENGTSFTRTFSSNPVCSPTRATIATGLCSRAHGLIMNGYALNPEIPTFMQVLQRKGWRTGAFGKLHLRPHHESLVHDYRPYGFDVVHGTEDDRAGEWLDWVKQAHPEHYEAALSTAWRDVPGFDKYGPEGIDLRPAIQAAQKRFPRATETWPKNSRKAYTLPFPEEVSQSSWITARALDFIRDIGADQSFFAHISYVAPHGPFCPPAEFMDRVEPEKIPAPIPAAWLNDANAPEYFRKMARVLHGESDDRPAWMKDMAVTPGSDEQPPLIPDLSHERHCYFADITHLDEQLGRVRKALEDSGRQDNTYIIFVSDHGEFLGDHGFWQKQERHYDGGIRVPLIIAGPGLQANAVCREIAQLEDICPTILEMTGVPLPHVRFRNFRTGSFDSAPAISGRSLVELCRGQFRTIGERRRMLNPFHAFGPGTLGAWARTVRTSRYDTRFIPMDTASNSSISRRIRTSRRILSTIRSIPLYAAN